MQWKDELQQQMDTVNMKLKNVDSLVLSGKPRRLGRAHVAPSRLSQGALWGPPLAESHRTAADPQLEREKVFYFGSVLPFFIKVFMVSLN